MDVNVITMPVADARLAFKEYRAAVRGDQKGSAWKKEDAELARAYKALSKGTRILDLLQVMKLAGVRPDGLPKFAIARSDAPKVWCNLNNNGGAIFTSHDQNARGWGEKSERITFPPDTFLRFSNYKPRAATLVPLIPPALRPKFKLSGYHTLWEVETWTLEPPRDPMLLRHLGGWLYAVLAAWDLTDIERAVLGMRGVS